MSSNSPFDEQSDLFLPNETPWEFCKNLDSCTFTFSLNVKKLRDGFWLVIAVFLMCFMDPNRVPRIENRDPRIRENLHWVPRFRENRVPRIREIGSLRFHIRYLTFSLKNLVIGFWKPSNTAMKILKVVE